MEGERCLLLEQEITNSLFYLKTNIKVTSKNNNELPTMELWRREKQNKTAGFSSLLPVLHFLAPFMVVGQQGCHLVGNSEDEVGTLGRALGDCHLLSLSPWSTLQMPAGTHNYILFCVCVSVCGVGLSPGPRTSEASTLPTNLYPQPHNYILLSPADSLGNCSVNLFNPHNSPGRKL